MKRVVLLLSVFAIAAFFAGQVNAQELSDADKVLIAVQEICPITGEKLGSHGTPVKAKLGEQELFLCCKACMEGDVDAKHWATIHANFAKAQASCPVMDKPLPEKPKWVVVKGHVFYVCCPPCTDKISAEPDKYVAELEALYKKSLEDRGVEIR
ncbi:MAG: hypothetical protein MPJ50_17335 [Pirellulales bacterium]|nr:hypothetical protein [Pirellulales bacterium]